MEQGRCGAHRGSELEARKWDLLGVNVSVFGEGLLRKRIINCTIRLLQLCQRQMHSVWLQRILIGVRKISWVNFPVGKMTRSDSPRDSLGAAVVGRTAGSG